MMHLKDGMCGGNAFTESLKEGSFAELSKRTETLYGLPDTHVGCQRESEKSPRVGSQLAGVGFLLAVSDYSIYTSPLDLLLG